MKKNLDKLDRTGIDEAIEYLNRKRAELLGDEVSENMLGPNPFVGISRRVVLGTARLAAARILKNPLNVWRHSLGFAREATRAAAAGKPVPVRLS